MAYKDQLQLQRTLGVTILSAVGSLLSKEVGVESQNKVEEAVRKIDEALLGQQSSDPEEYDQEETVTTVTKKKKPSQNRVLQMAQHLHEQFSRLNGIRTPLNSALSQAMKNQMDMQERFKNVPDRR